MSQIIGYTYGFEYRDADESIDGLRQKLKVYKTIHAAYKALMLYLSSIENNVRFDEDLVENLKLETIQGIYLVVGYIEHYYHEDTVVVIKPVYAVDDE